MEKIDNTIQENGIMSTEKVNTSSSNDEIGFLVDKCYDNTTSVDHVTHYIDLIRERAPEGYGEKGMRQKVWPLLLGISSQDIDVSYAEYISENHEYYDQIQKDVARSCTHFDIHASFTPEELRNERIRLGRILHALFSKHLDLHYVQGIHDVASVISIVFGNDEATAFAVMERVATVYMRDSMQTSLNRTLKLMSLVLPLIAANDTELYEFFKESEMDSIFVLSWLLTWMAHNISSSERVCRVFDFLLASHPLMPLYFCVAVIMHHRDELLDLTPDIPSLMCYFQNCSFDDVDSIVPLTLSLWLQCPPHTAFYEFNLYIAASTGSTLDVDAVSNTMKALESIGDSPLLLTHPSQISQLAGRVNNGHSKRESHDLEKFSEKNKDKLLMVDHVIERTRSECDSDSDSESDSEGQGNNRSEDGDITEHTVDSKTDVNQVDCKKDVIEDKDGVNSSSNDPTHFSDLVLLNPSQSSHLPVCNDVSSDLPSFSSQIPVNTTPIDSSSLLSFVDSPPDSSVSSHSARSQTSTTPSLLPSDPHSRCASGDVVDVVGCVADTDSPCVDSRSLLETVSSIASVSSITSTSESASPFSPLAHLDGTGNSDDDAIDCKSETEDMVGEVTSVFKPKTLSQAVSASSYQGVNSSEAIALVNTSVDSSLGPDSDTSLNSVNTGNCETSLNSTLLNSPSEMKSEYLTPTEFSPNPEANSTTSESNTDKAKSSTPTDSEDFSVPAPMSSPPPPPQPASSEETTVFFDEPLTHDSNLKVSPSSNKRSKNKGKNKNTILKEQFKSRCKSYFDRVPLPTRLSFNEHLNNKLWPYTNGRPDISPSSSFPIHHLLPTSSVYKQMFYETIPPSSPSPSLPPYISSVSYYFTHLHLPRAQHRFAGLPRFYLSSSLSAICLLIFLYTSVTALLLGAYRITFALLPPRYLGVHRSYRRFSDHVWRYSSLLSRVGSDSLHLMVYGSLPPLPHPPISSCPLWNPNPRLNVPFLGRCVALSSLLPNIYNSPVRDELDVKEKLD